MKIISFLLSICLICQTGITQPPTDWQAYQLKNKVKTLTSKETYRYKKDGVNFTPWERTYGRITKFDKTGMKTEFIELNKFDSINYKVVYVYDPKTKRTEVSYFDKNLNPTTRHTYFYNDKGFKTEELQYDKSGKFDRRYTYTYDAKGNLLESKNFKNNGDQYSKTSYKYDDKNNNTEYLVETTGYSNSSRKFSYDATGNMIEEAWYDGWGKISFRFVRTYDSNSNKIKEVKYKNESTTPHDTLYWKYNYDKKGNWIKRTQSTSDGTDFHIEERTITYF